jgi:four helix bundle protein
VRDTIGKQLVRTIESIGSILVERRGSYRDAEAVRFFRIARGSASEARCWTQRAVNRGILSPDSVRQKFISSDQPLSLCTI